MKILVIVCLAKYYHRIQMDKINSFQGILIAVVILILPIMLVVSQPDLGTSILIALSGLVVVWLAGINIQYFLYSFLSLLVSLPFVISFLKPYQKLRVLTFIDPDKDPFRCGLSNNSIKNSCWIWWLKWKRFFERYTELFRIFTRKTYRFYFYIIC